MASANHMHDLLRPRSGKPIARSAVRAQTTSRARAQPPSRQQQGRQEHLLATAGDDHERAELLASFDAGGLLHGHGEAAGEAEPTDALPGSPEKVCVLAARAAAGQALFHAKDRRTDRADALARLRDLVERREPEEDEG